MKRLFGTDGIRGIAGKELTGTLAHKVGLATAKMLTTNPFKTAEKTPFGDKLPVVLIGRDTRSSGDMIISGLSCGLCEGGVNVLNVGILPTPAVAYLTNYYSFASVGIMITASHNPKQYNGIKIIGADGYKLADELEQEVEELISSINDETIHSFYGSTIGRVNNEYKETARTDYLRHISSIFNFDKSRPLTVAIDCSNGSASTCYKVIESLGITAEKYNTDLSGEHINENCGSMHLNFLQDLMKKEKNNYDCGIAFDGDADRCLLVDELGEIVDGDQILAIVGHYLKIHNKLKNDTIVGTIMSNLGLVNFCGDNDIKFLSTKVGDKYVLEEMLINDCVLGGEQSGHIIFKEHATTGDGILTALMVLKVMNELKLPLSELKELMNKYPQVSTQITATSKEKAAFLANTSLRQKIASREKEVLGNKGRVIVRPSGTENCIRIMVEGINKEIITKLCEEIKEMILLSKK